MKHLFIVNPIAEKTRGELGEIRQSIADFFANYPQIRYDIHVTRWSRDAVGFVRRYVTSTPEMVRVHVIGGDGTVFEALNGIVGLTNAQLAAYPYGMRNLFIDYFGADKEYLFNSLRSQVFSGVTGLDVLHYGNHYGLTMGFLGLEAEALLKSKERRALYRKLHIPFELGLSISFFNYALRRTLSGEFLHHHYTIELDGKSLDGEYISIFIGNTPCSGQSLEPGSSAMAHPNDGLLDLCLVKEMHKMQLLSMVSPYASHEYPDKVLHFTGRKISIRSERVTCLLLDGESFYNDKFDIELLPYAVDVVCPQGIDIEQMHKAQIQ